MDRVTINTENKMDVVLTIDMDEMGIRPSDWADFGQDKSDSMYDIEKNVDLTVYSAELQFTDNKNKLNYNENSSMMEEQDSGEYEIDPETGEKVFHQAATTSDIALPSPDSEWINDYLSNLGTLSNDMLLETTTSDFDLDTIPLILNNSLNPTGDLEWLTSVVDTEETKNDTVFPSLNYLNQETTLSVSNYDSSSNDYVFANVMDDDNSTSYGMTSENHRNSSSEETSDVVPLTETKLEIIETDVNSIASTSNTRLQNQRLHDEEILRQLNIPLTVNDITQTTTEEYNRHLAQLSNLTSEQIRVIKDIRRRGKNKIAAQNCRKRKATNVETLSDEVDELKRMKNQLEERKAAYQQQILEIRNQYEYLHRHLLPNHQMPPAITVSS